LLQKLVNEIKLLIKEQHRAGKKGPLDLTSSEVTEKLEQRQMRKRQSHAQSFEPAPLEESAGTDGLLSAMTQLAWEKDINLSTSPKVGDPIREEEEKTASAGKRGKTVTPPAPKSQANLSQNNKNFSSPVGRSSKVAPHAEKATKSAKKPKQDKRVAIAMTGSKSSLNSASSLTSLLQGQKERATQNDTEF
jgi:hypothetical protein